MNGIILYEGPSLIDGQPIVAIATGLENGSGNRKTGDMIQTWIIRQDKEPHLALKSGEDSSVCGDCKHRPANTGTCYVQVAWAPYSVYKAYKNGTYKKHNNLSEIGTGRKIRLGSYGDPAAVPIAVWKSFTKDANMFVGYTHQWKKCGPGLRKYCMASVDNEVEAKAASKKGWRYFRVKKEDGKLVGEVICPASEEKSKVLKCEQCGACGGTSSKSTAHISIKVHGATKNRFN